MDSAQNTVLSFLGTSRPSCKVHTPDSPHYEDLRKTYVNSSARPFAIARPQKAEDVQSLVRACRENGVDFSIRTGGHNCVGRALVDNALTIDMREIDYVKVSEDKKTARVGGGVLLGGLLKALGEHGLVTPSGSVASVGYVGWSTLGGYGPLSSLHGLGVDQIVGAKIVNDKGDIVDAEADLLKGIRGAGPIFGPIVELTIKVYPLDKIFAMDFPGAGKVLSAIPTWASEDHDEGRKWIEKVASLGTCIMNTTDAKTPATYAEDNEKLAPYGVYGRSFTLNVREFTEETSRVLAEYSEQVPSGNCMISVHSLRLPKENEDSVFGAREVHHMVEMVSMGVDPALEAQATTWGQALQNALRERDSGNILDSAYISLLDYDDANVEKIYNKHLDTLVGLKKKYDPENVFHHAAPRLLVQ
ncbi:6-hydroxy-D-nicotine oxidase [Emericellopsis cladophorae]|uniref:6-hydroxy-D-nicotine oxidase n=1 Tax=Emericellopsis cladophorae TaxID=2686198 RepID=A0A9Q0BAZ7_9HYPO|nr:6-hydroxy-D-nicotine oxidase [Emericellopsis cladophorae]KAI6778747.1 6-hydroxy-D-nicotine oxidase [Emericellopsis cladophorae]